MALPNTGAISFSMVNLQLHRPEMQQISLHDIQVRGLAGKTSGAIGLDDLRGKYAGAKLTAARIRDDVFGFQAPPPPVGELAAGELVGLFGGVSMQRVTWARLSSSFSVLSLATVAGANQPTATEILVRGPNFEPILQQPISSWSLSNGAWIVTVSLPPNTPNPFLIGGVRWIS